MFMCVCACADMLMCAPARHVHDTACMQKQQRSEQA